MLVIVIRGIGHLGHNLEHIHVGILLDIVHHDSRVASLHVAHLPVLASPREIDDEHLSFCGSFAVLLSVFWNVAFLWVIAAASHRYEGRAKSQRNSQ